MTTRPKTCCLETYFIPYPWAEYFDIPVYPAHDTERFRSCFKLSSRGYHIVGEGYGHVCLFCRAMKAMQCVTQQILALMAEEVHVDGGCLTANATLRFGVIFLFPFLLCFLQVIRCYLELLFQFIIIQQKKSCY